MVPKRIANLLTVKCAVDLFVYCLMATTAVYEISNLARHYYHICATDVSFISSPAQLQLPALSVCVPGEEVIAHSVAHWESQPNSQFHAAVAPIKRHLAACGGGGGTNLKMCTGAVLQSGGAIMSVKDWFTFAVTEADHYFRLYATFDNFTQVELFTPQVNWASMDLCFVYFYRNSPTMARRVAYDRFLTSLNVPVNESSHEEPLFPIASKINQFVYMEFRIENRLHDAKVAATGSAPAPLQVSFHSPIVKVGQFQSHPLGAGRYVSVKFSYSTMIRDTCATDRCDIYPEAAVGGNVTAEQVSGMRIAPGSHQDCVLRQAIRDAAQNLSCLPFGTFMAGLGRPDLDQLNITQPHCAMRQTTEAPLTLTTFMHAARLSGVCLQDCTDLAYKITLTDQSNLTPNSNNSSPVSSSATNSSILLFPEQIPFMEVRRKPSMTHTELMCQACGLLGMWFGFSIFALYGSCYQVACRLASGIKRWLLRETGRDRRRKRRRNTNAAPPAQSAEVAIATAKNYFQENRNYVTMEPIVIRPLVFALNSTFGNR